MSGKKIKLHDYGNIKEIQTFSDDFNPKENLSKISILDKDNYICHETGELRQVNHYESKYDSLPYVRKQMNKDRRIILYNTSDQAENVYFVTLTYAQHHAYSDIVNDEKKLKDKLRYRFPDYQYAIFEQVQINGNYHLHCLLWSKDPDNPLTLTEELMTTLWNQGTKADVKRLSNYEDLINVLFYLTTYSINNNTKNKQKILDKIEGLKQFPPKSRLCKKSANLKEPNAMWIENLDGFENNYKEYLNTQSFGINSKMLIKAS